MTQKFTVTKLSSYPECPNLEFVVDHDTIRAETSGAKLYGEACDDGSRVRLTDATGFVLADITVHVQPGRNHTDHTCDVGSALMWSHWRYLKAQEAAA